MKSRLLVLATVVAVAPLTFAQPAHAAPTFTFGSTQLSWTNEPGTPTVLGCTGGNVANQGVAIAPVVRCTEVVGMLVNSSPLNGALPNTIDLRGVTVAAFPALAFTVLNGNGSGNDLIYGTPAADTITGMGSAYGLGGNDTIQFAGKVWGGGGNDAITGSLGPDELNGGYGSDVIYGDTDGWYESCPGGDVLIGGPGNDTISAVGTDVSAAGGLGDDLIYVEAECGGALRVDGNEGTDTITHIVYRQTAFKIVRAAAGTVFSKFDNASTPQVIYKHQRVETVAIGSTAGVRIVMQTGVAFLVRAAVYSETSLDITVPGGVWTPGDHIVTAPNLGQVTWTDSNNYPPTKVTVHA